jgi:hypothetical protein
MIGMLTQRELNRALLARQGLLEPFDEALPRVLERVGGIQAQYAPSMYIGLWSRMASFDRTDLTSALESAAAVQGTLLRGTIHLVSRKDYWPFHIGCRDAVHEMYARNYAGTATELEKWISLLRDALTDNPLRQREIDELVGRDLRGWVTSHLPLLRIPPSGTWERRRADLYALADDIIGTEDMSLAPARELLVRRYLGGFGPSTLAEIASWAGMGVREITPAVEQIDHVTYEAEDGAVLYDLPGAPLPDGQTPVPIRFLPTWDATLLVHARRTQILPEEHRDKIFTSTMPHSYPTFLIDGAVAGTWRYESGRVELTPFERLPARTLREVEEAAEPLAELHR